MLPRHALPNPVNRVWHAHSIAYLKRLHGSNGRRFLTSRSFFNSGAMGRLCSCTLPGTGTDACCIHSFLLQRTPTSCSIYQYIATMLAFAETTGYEDVVVSATSIARCKTCQQKLQLERSAVRPLCHRTRDCLAYFLKNITPGIMSILCSRDGFYKAFIIHHVMTIETLEERITEFPMLFIWLLLARHVAETVPRTVGRKIMQDASSCKPPKRGS